MFVVVAGWNVVPLLANDLIIRKIDKTASVAISELGNLNTDLNLTTKAGVISGTPGCLLIRKVSDINLAITQTEMLIKNDIIPNNISPAITGDLVVKKSDLPHGEAEQAIVHEGDLILKGESNNLPLASATYYVDEEGVFEQKKGETDPNFAYANITTLDETV